MRSIIVASALAALAGTAVVGGAQAQVSPALSAPPSTAQTSAQTPVAQPAVAPPLQAASASAGLHAPQQLPSPSACPGNPDALGVSRTIAIDPKTSPLLGRLQYKQTLPLEKGEVVLTFDDGPLPPMTNRVLDALAHECVKATFFIVGRMAGAYPHVLQKVSEAGHTIGTHSQTHPLIFPKLTQQAGLQEIEQGFASVKAALAPIGATPNPWFRFPGLGRTKFYEAYTQEHGIAVFSVDAVADDWMHLKPDEVEKRALDRLTASGGGILLLHDIQPSTAVMLPSLLRELKARGFKIVHVVNATPGVMASTPTGGPRGTPVASAPPAAAAPGATAAAAKPAANPAAAKPATPKPVAAKPAAADAVASAPLPAAAPAPAAEAGTRTVSEPQENPFTQFWPRLWTDSLPKGLQ
ncbi:polysaccharide deacetylase family protein [Azorhizobium sp. AG788]|uniref:polysaccharide deacetylase family protein n=1 Tax=Azorhizobium sp. AG788 TaxID=2183897 RepID=UPI003139200A